jgi:hypothetical protein
MRIIRTSIAFDMYPDQDTLFSEMDLTDEQLLEYAKDCFYDDIMTLMENNELWECIDVTMMEFDDV